jgi:hypothetical protein
LILGNIVLKSAKHKATAKQAGAIEVVVDALAVQTHVPGVVEAAAGFLRNFATSDM